VEARALTLVALSLCAIAAAGCGATPATPHAACGGGTPARVPRPHPAPAVPSFGSPAKYAIAPSSGGGLGGGASRAVAIGDLNGDGHADVVAVNPAKGSKRVSVLLNRGDGTLAPRRDYRTGRGSNAVAIGDLNCDGTADLVVADAAAQSVSVLLNRGEGSFRPKRDFRAGDTPWSIAIGDLNGDGNRDLAVANLNGRPPGGGREPGTVSVLLNDGKGGFGDRTDYGTAGSPTSVSATDLNENGHLDLAVGKRFGNLVFLLLNQGDGRFEAGRHYETGIGDSWLTTGDLTGDGVPDLALVANDQSYEVQESGVTLEPARVSTFANSGDASFGQERGFFVTRGYMEEVGPPVVADLNRDGKADVVVPRWDELNQEMGIVSLFLNDGRGRFRDDARVDYLVGGIRSVDAIAFGDLDGDGRLDLVAGNLQSSRLSVFMARRACTVQDVSGTTQHVGLNSRGRTLAAATHVLARANCRAGTVRKKRSIEGVAKGLVSAQRPEFGTVLPAGAKVDLVVSSGP
jgi:FG-GAP-like repeat/FG-GAP repeat/PASTA domain